MLNTVTESLENDLRSPRRAGKLFWRLCRVGEGSPQAAVSQLRPEGCLEAAGRVTAGGGTGVGESTRLGNSETVLNRRTVTIERLKSMSMG